MKTTFKKIEFSLKNVVDPRLSLPQARGAEGPFWRKNPPVVASTDLRKSVFWSGNHCFFNESWFEKF